MSSDHRFGGTPPRMHADEVCTDPSLVAHLVAAQFPHWADLPVRRVPSTGTDHALYRLGPDLLVRMPRIFWAVDQVPKEQSWLPRLAPFLPLSVPEPVALGRPGLGYPWHWSVFRWLEGVSPAAEEYAACTRTVADLVRFLGALQAIDPQDGPPATSRGGPLAERDGATRQAISALAGTMDVEAVAARWTAALQAPAWEGRPVWIHGDLMPGNLLFHRGQLHGIIDFGCVCVGDPACDLMIAWYLFDGPTRRRFREAMAADDAAWARGRGWALSQALIFIPYYRETNPVGVAWARRAIAQILADPGTTGS